MENSIATANNDFGFRLYANLFKKDKEVNVFISPFSIAAALAMTYNGARGETQRAMATVLGLSGMELAQVNQEHAELNASLEASGSQILIAIANSLWGQKGLDFDPGFVQRCLDHYAARITNMDFTAPDALPTINGWVAEKTMEKIKDLLKAGDVGPMTVLVLINAIYFKGIWKNQFDPQKTKEGQFTLLDGSQTKCPMMTRSGNYAYKRGTGFQAVSMPYGNGRLSMYIFLPDEDSSLAEFAAQISTANWDEWMGGFYTKKIDLVVPRFKIEYEAELSAALTTLGMGTAFGAGADFSGMGAGELLISKVRHKTFLEVNEEGSEAAAATAVVMARGLMDKLYVVVNRPFFCAIRDNHSGAILFMGSIVKPE